MRGVQHGEGVKQPGEQAGRVGYPRIEGHRKSNDFAQPDLSRTPEDLAIQGAIWQ